MISKRELVSLVRQTDTWQEPCRAFLPLGLVKGSLGPKLPSIFPPALAIDDIASYNPHHVAHIFRSKACPGRKNDAFPSHKTPVPLLYWRFLMELWLKWYQPVPNQPFKERNQDGCSPPCLAESQPTPLEFQPFLPSTLEMLPWKEEGVED